MAYTVCNPISIYQFRIFFISSSGFRYQIIHGTILLKQIGPDEEK